MMRHVKIPILLLILAIFTQLGCVKDESLATSPANKKPDCKFTLPDKPPSLTDSNSPELLATPFDQSRLTTLMSLAATDDVCFIRSQGNVTIYKITDTFAALSVGDENPENPLFTALAPAPEDLMSPWKALEEHFDLPLMGLTFIEFYDRPEHREIINSRILMNPKARPWHMWHEFGHYLIAQTRLASRGEKLKAPSPTDIEEAQKTLIESLDKNELAQAQVNLGALIDVYHRYDQRVHLEEMAIELALLHYAGEAENERIATQDPEESLRTVRFFYETHFDWYRDFFKQIRPLVKKHPELKAQVAEMQKTLEENDKKMFEQIRIVRERFSN